MPAAIRMSTVFGPSATSEPRMIEPDLNKMIWSRCGMVHLSGVGRGKPIVVLPGLAGGSRMLEPLIAELAKQYRVYWFDWAGEGRSFALEALRQDDHPTRLLADVLDAIPEPSVSVLGISYGGCVALDLAQHMPGKIERLILTGTPGKLEHAWASRLVHRVLTRIPLRPDSAFLNQFFRILMGDQTRDSIVERFVAECVWSTDQAMMARRLDWLMSFELSESIRNMLIPTTILTGARDVVVPPLCQEKLANALPESDMYVIQDAGHLGFLTHTKTYMNHIHRAMSNQPVAALSA